MKVILNININYWFNMKEGLYIIIIDKNVKGSKSRDR